mgnify:CR=1 FL=1
MTVIASASDYANPNEFDPRRDAMQRRWILAEQQFEALRRRVAERFELDPASWVIWVMEKLGLVWDVVRITPERQAQRLAGQRERVAG